MEWRCFQQGRASWRTYTQRHKKLIHHNEIQQHFLTVFQCFSALLSRSSPTVVKWGILYSPPLLFWLSDAQKHVHIFRLPDCVVRNSRSLRESFTHPSSAHTDFATAAATNPNWTWAIGTGSVDARCMLKLECARQTPLSGMPLCHALCIYANARQGNGLLERAPVVPSSKIYATGEMKRTWLSFSWRKAVWRSGETLFQTVPQFKTPWWLISGDKNLKQTWW